MTRFSGAFERSSCLTAAQIEASCGPQPPSAVEITLVRLWRALSWRIPETPLSDRDVWEPPVRAHEALGRLDSTLNIIFCKEGAHPLAVALCWGVRIRVGRVVRRQA